MALDVKTPKGYRKAWNGGVKPTDPNCPQCHSNRNVSPRSVNTKNGDSTWECSACAITFDVTADEVRPSPASPKEP